MTRTLGDLQAKKIGLISDPEIEIIDLISQDKFIVIGSDGIWDVMQSAEVCGFVETWDKNGNPREGCAEALVLEARKRWEQRNGEKRANKQKGGGGVGIGDLPFLKSGCDDITCVIAYITFKTEEEMEEEAR